MAQNPDKPTAPSLSLASLKIRSAELSNGINNLNAEIRQLELILIEKKNDRLSTQGAKTFVDQLIAGAEKEQAVPPAVVAPAAAPDTTAEVPPAGS